jgi:hypothetical protein
MNYQRCKSILSASQGLSLTTSFVLTILTAMSRDISYVGRVFDRVMESSLATVANEIMFIYTVTVQYFNEYYELFDD